MHDTNDNTARSIAQMAANCGEAVGAANGLSAAAKQLRVAEKRYRQQVVADVQKRFWTKCGRVKALAELESWIAVFGQVADALEKAAAPHGEQAKNGQHAVEAALAAHEASLGGKPPHRFGAMTKALLGR